MGFKGFYLLCISGLFFLVVTSGCSKIKGAFYHAGNKLKELTNLGETSKATGMKINKKGEFSYPKRYKGQDTPPGMVFVEGGTFVMGAVQDDVMHDWNNEPHQIHVQSFYMDETEVTNKMYNQYLFWTKKVYPPTDETYGQIYGSVLPDTLCWRNSLGFNEVMVNNYLRHPAFSNYPVVGVTWKQAVAFCEWRTNRVNEHILEKRGFLDDRVHEKVGRVSDDEGDSDDIGEGEDGESLDRIEVPFDTNTYMKAPGKTYGGRASDFQGYRKSEKDTVVYAKVEDGIFMPEFRLPTEAEWEYAAGAWGPRKYNKNGGRKKYPWVEKYTRNSSYRRIGVQLANFKQGRGDYGGIAGWSDDYGDITVKVKTYPPNMFGLYDMAGNVSEWVYDVYRPLVDNGSSDFNYFRGNIYKQLEIDNEGNPVSVEDGEVDYDTLLNGKVFAKILPGQLREVSMSKTDTLMRTNFNRSYNVDYNDGDIITSIYNPDPDLTEEEKLERRMYKSPVNKVSFDEDTGRFEIEVDKSDDRTTLISDKTRVYKGGSWKDRAFWLDPSQRRYKAEFLSSDDLGFRCAVSRLGDKSLMKRRRTKYTKRRP